jgi:integrase
MPGPKPKLHLPFTEWPEIDKRMWNEAVTGDDPFDDGPGGRLAKRTLHKYWMGWRRLLGFLTLADPNALKASPLERLTKDRVRRFVGHLAQTNTPHSVAIQMDSLYGAARTMMPNTNWTWLRDMKTRLYAAAPRGNSVRPVITSVQLIDLGIALMEESNIEADKPIRMADAVRYRDGLMIALLGYVPLRHKNFAAIEIGRDLIREEGGNWYIVIPPEETKTKTSIEFEIPEELRDRLSTYLNYVRPRMLRRIGCRALWVSPKGGPLSYSAVGPVMTRNTTERLGIRITPHDARDAAATTWAIKAPGQIGIARDLLAHDDLRTTTKYYNRARGIEASRAHNQAIARLRGKSGRGGGGRGRGSSIT